MEPEEHAARSVARQTRRDKAVPNLMGYLPIYRTSYNYTAHGSSVPYMEFSASALKLALFSSDSELTEMQNRRMDLLV